MKRSTLNLMLLSALVTPVAVAQDMASIDKEISILNSIIKTSISESKNKRLGRLVDIQSTYLAKQGVVTTISLSGMPGFHRLTMPVPPIPPVPPVPPVNGDWEMEIDEESHWQMYAEDMREMSIEAMEQAHEALHGQRERFREAQEQLRDAEYQLREVEREKRNLAFQKRHADADETKAIDTKIQALEKSLQEKKAEREALQAKRKLVEKEYREKAKLRQEEDKKAREQYVQLLENITAHALCDYGNSLRSLPKDEYVTFVFAATGDGHNNKRKDSIYVYSKADIQACVASTLNADKLLEKSTKYQF